MGIFGSRGTDGLPPRDDDEDGQDKLSSHQRRALSGVCHTLLCERPTRRGERFCPNCQLHRLELLRHQHDTALRLWPTRPDTSETPAVNIVHRATAQMAFFEVIWRDPHCRWCRYLIGESVQVALRPQDEDGECAHHQQRRLAHGKHEGSA